MKSIKKLLPEYIESFVPASLDELRVGEHVIVRRDDQYIGTYCILCRPNMFDSFGDVLTLVPVVSQMYEGNMIHLPTSIAKELNYQVELVTSLELIGKYVESLGKQAESSYSSLSKLLVGPEEVQYMRSELEELRITDEFCSQVFPSLLFSESENSVKIQSWSKLYPRLNRDDIISFEGKGSSYYAILEVPGEYDRSIYSPWVLAPYNADKHSVRVSEAFEYYFSVNDRIAIHAEAVI